MDYLIKKMARWQANRTNARANLRVVMNNKAAAVRQSTIFARAKAAAPAIAVSPFSHNDQGIMTCLSMNIISWK